MSVFVRDTSNVKRKVFNQEEENEDLSRMQLDGDRGHGYRLNHGKVRIILNK